MCAAALNYSTYYMLGKIYTCVFYMLAIYFIFAKFFLYIRRTFDLIVAKEIKWRSTSKWHATVIFLDPSDACHDGIERKLSWYSGIVRTFKFRLSYVYPTSISGVIENMLLWHICKQRVDLTGLDFKVLVGTREELRPYCKRDLSGINVTGCSIGSVEQAIKIFANLPSIVE